MVDKGTIEKILELRQQGYSIREISKRVGLSHSTVWRILKKYETSQKQSDTSQKASKQVETSHSNCETVTSLQQDVSRRLETSQMIIQGLIEHVRTLENNILNLSQDVENLKIFQSIIQQVARLRIEGPTRCKYIDEYGYCTKILLTECIPGTKCIEVILGDGTKMYRPKVVDSPIICLACPHYKPRKL